MPFIKHKMLNQFVINKIATIYYLEFDKNYSHIAEKHDFWEMVYIDRGEAIAYGGQRRHILRQGEALFHKPNEFHSLAANGASVMNVFIITFVCNSKSMDYFKEEKIKIPPKLQNYIKLILEEGRASFYLHGDSPQHELLTPRNNAPFGGQQLICLYLHVLLIQLVRSKMQKAASQNFPINESIENHIATKIIGILKNNIYGKITVNEICRTLNYSRTYLSNHFKNSCNCSILEYCT